MLAHGKTTWAVFSCTLLLVGFLGLGAEPAIELPPPVPLLAGDDLSAWRQPTGEWQLCSRVWEPTQMRGKLRGKPGAGIALNGPNGKTDHLVSVMEHGDAQVHVEFMVPRGSNSGVYLQGRYEIQILDSFGVGQPHPSDCGGIYQRWREDPGLQEDQRGYDGHPPILNGAKAPGEWQALDITFRAPRFDADGKKTENAKMVKVILNGFVIHENVELTGPTRASLFKDEQPLGPLMLQGDHGPVAFRNVMVRPIDEEKEKALKEREAKEAAES